MPNYADLGDFHRAVLAYGKEPEGWIAACSQTKQSVGNSEAREMLDEEAIWSDHIKIAEFLEAEWIKGMGDMLESKPW